MPVALITGASSGIGLELARLFARDGIDVVLVARSERSLRELADQLSADHDISAHVVPADLDDPRAPEGIVQEIERRGVVVDFLVNSAGFGLGGRFADQDLARQLSMLQVNISALTHLTRLILPGMLERKRGRIIQIASTAAFQPGPLMAVYYASKAYVLSFSEAVAEEVSGTGVTITALCPGPTRTNFAKVAGAQVSARFRQPGVMSAERVAAAGYRAMMKGRRVAIPGLLNLLFVQATRIAPRIVTVKLSRFIQERAKGFR
jgi:uncharacterized protein